MSDIEVLSDGTWHNPSTGATCRPPAPLEMRTDGDGRSKIHAVLSFDGRTLTPQLIEELIDFYEFTQKSLGGMKVKIG